MRWSDEPSRDLVRLLKANSKRECRSAHRIRLECPSTINTKSLERACLVVERSGIAPYLDRRLHSHPGLKSQLSSFALVVGMVLAFQVHSNVQSVSVTKALASLRSVGRAKLGLYARDYRPLSYDVIEYQLKRLEAALSSQGWIDEDGTVCDLVWFNRMLIEASVPPERLAETRAIAVDATALETWAITRYFGKRSLADDPMASYQKAVLEGDVPEPEISAPKPPEGSPGEQAGALISPRDLIGTLGPDRRRIVSLDPDARAGYRTATRRKKAGYFAGYHLHIGVAMAEFRWNGDPSAGRDEGSYSDVSGYILGAHVATASSHSGHAGTALVESAMKIAPGIDEVVVDRGYTCVKPETFLRKMHLRDLNVVMDYSSYQLASVKTITSTRNNKASTFIAHAGILYHPTLPPGLLDGSGAQRSTDMELRELSMQAQDYLVATYRWSEHQRLSGGRIRFKCPLCGGRATNAQLNPKTIANSDKVPVVQAPDGMDFCCAGITTLGPKDLDFYQQVPWGTHAWAASYGRRQLVETANSRIKRRLNSDKGLVCAFGMAAMAVGVAAMVAALNIDLSVDRASGTVLGSSRPARRRRIRRNADWFQVSGELDQAQSKPDPPPLISSAIHGDGNRGQRLESCPVLPFAA